MCLFYVGCVNSTDILLFLEDASHAYFLSCFITAEFFKSRKPTLHHMNEIHRRTDTFLFHNLHPQNYANSANLQNEVVL